MMDGWKEGRKDFKEQQIERVLFFTEQNLMQGESATYLKY